MHSTELLKIILRKLLPVERKSDICHAVAIDGNPKPKNMTHFKFNDGGRSEAGFKGTAGDCVCRAIAIATGKPYAEIHEALSNGNATQRLSKWQKKKRGQTADNGINTNRKWFSDYMKSLGFVWKPTMLIGQGCKVHLKSDELPSGTIICALSKHLTCVIDGIINDTHDPSRDGTRCVYGYYFKP